MVVDYAATFCFVLIAKHCQHGFAWLAAAAGVGVKSCVDSVISGTCTGPKCMEIGVYFSRFFFALHKIFMLPKYFYSQHNKQIYILAASDFFAW